MTSGTVMPIVRVAILADSRLTEIALPTELPLREILPAVQRLMVVPSDPEASNGDAGAAAAGAQLSLAPIGGAPFSLDASLDTVGVVDGDLLALQPVPAGPAAPGIVEDIADAAMIFSTSRLRPWGAAHIRRGALAAGIAVGLLATGLGTGYRAATGALGGLVAVAVIAVFAAVAAVLLNARSPRAAMPLSVAALAPIAAALALAVPGRFGPAHLMLAAAGVTAWSLIVLMLPGPERERVVGTFTATAVVGAGVLLAAAAESLWRPSLVAIGAALIVAALLVTVEAAPLSALAARFPLPVIPAPGDPTPSAPSPRVLEDLPRRVRISDAHQSGFIAAAVLLSVLGSVAIAPHPQAVSGAGWYVVAATAAASVLRARVWDSAACKAWLLGQPFLAAGTLTVIYTATGHYPAALGAVLVLAALALVWLIVALNPRVAEPETYSLPVRRLVGFVAGGLDASLIPVMAYLVGLFTWILNR
ncbi:type VII secretion integral membrane protein EccD [Mycobacterium bohemicum]|uniref:Type VII secretion integral membrane protein EccD n=1 Tax=Mycobacterium bohemicum TaxID=56425 RepID=A0A1X1R1J0_MYCBE|nr:type VII secretion integral membrane protein EccD [Mycobacterium bohemicum]MCV6970169.1 type VII secretion integral membrane protein EccD [Mycobacterium bohemicum]ORU97929.1 type VII secretion integral membrane protein EccD [Mycobacterium bohemicum]ORU97977.1 type VII secretion integral membrane protein EccD [Mycobacterium bohemicum]